MSHGIIVLMNLYSSMIKNTIPKRCSINQTVHQSINENNSTEIQQCFIH